jgi:hypothetical protein
MAAKLPIQDVPVIPELGMVPRSYESKRLTKIELTKLIATHSIENIFEEWAKDPQAVRNKGVQLAIHRLLFDWARGINDNSERGLVELIRAHLNIGERDAVKCKENDKFISAHPMTTDRLLEGPGVKIGATKFAHLVGKPLGIPQVSDGEFTGESHLTGEVITSLMEQLRDAILKYPGYNEIEDLRNADIVEFIKLAFEHLKSILPRILVQSYPYVYKTFEDVREALALPLGWQSHFNYAPCLTAEILISRAYEQSALSDGGGVDTSVANLEKIAEDYYAPWIKQSWRMIGAHLGIGGVGDWLQDDEETAIHPNGHIFKKHDNILKIRAVKALNNFNERLLTKHPKVMRITMVRGADFIDKNTGEYYFFSITNGLPTKCPAKGTEDRLLMEGVADHRYALNHADLVMTDDVMECLELISGRTQ